MMSGDGLHDTPDMQTSNDATVLTKTSRKVRSMKPYGDGFEQGIAHLNTCLFYRQE